VNIDYCTEGRSITEPLCAITALGDAHNPHHHSLSTVADWVTEINRFLPRDRTATFELARLLYDAKQTLRYGQWAALWRAGRIHFSQRKGEYLVFVWEKLGDLDAQHAAQLPPRWNTLYYLAQLDRSTLERLIRKGTIHPRLTRRAAKELVSKPKGKSKVNVRQRLQQLRELFLATLPDWTLELREFAETELLDLAHQIALCEPQCKQSQESDLRASQAPKTLSASGEVSSAEPIHFPSVATLCVQ